jgi:hypothetical protein
MLSKEKRYTFAIIRFFSGFSKKVINANIELTISRGKEYKSQ